MKRMLDLFAGRLGWSKTFLDRGWKVTAVDLVRPPTVPEGMEFLELDVTCNYVQEISKGFDFICASPPCEQFSKFGMACFYPNPPYPADGIRLFNHTRAMLWNSGVPWVIENVNSAQKFIGYASQHSGPFYLWGTGVPPMLPQGIIKGGRLGTGGWQHTGTKNKKDNAAIAAMIPPELAVCIADYAERVCSF
jgi:hypothetical protein